MKEHPNHHYLRICIPAGSYKSDSSPWAECGIFHHLFHRPEVADRRNNRLVKLLLGYRSHSLPGTVPCGWGAVGEQKSPQQKQKTCIFVGEILTNPIDPFTIDPSTSKSIRGVYVLFFVVFEAFWSPIVVIKDRWMAWSTQLPLLGVAWIAINPSFSGDFLRVDRMEY